jgi:hypothetical protein
MPARPSHKRGNGAADPARNPVINTDLNGSNVHRTVAGMSLSIGGGVVTIGWTGKDWSIWKRTEIAVDWWGISALVCGVIGAVVGGVPGFWIGTVGCGLIFTVTIATLAIRESWP